jgi:hypothetical protein
MKRKTKKKKSDRKVRADQLRREILSVIEAKGKTYVADICREMNLGKNAWMTIGRHVKCMVDDGLVRETTTPQADSGVLPFGDLVKIPGGGGAWYWRYYDKELKSNRTVSTGTTDRDTAWHIAEKWAEMYVGHRDRIKNRRWYEIADS